MFSTQGVIIQGDSDNRKPKDCENIEQLSIINQTISQKRQKQAIFFQRKQPVFQ